MISPHLRTVRAIAFQAVALVVLIAPFILGSVAFAQPREVGGNPGPTPVGGNPPASQSSGEGQTLMNPLKVDSLEELLQIVLAAIVQIGVIVLTIMLVWTGFLFIRARGNPGKITEAKQALFWTVAGGFILLAAEAIGLVIKSTAETL